MSFYDELMAELIEIIRDDNEANSATVQRLVERLQELRALGESEIFGRAITVGQGLAGGGTLEDDIVIELATTTLDALERAGSSVQPGELATTLAGYAKASSLSEYVKKADSAPVHVIPFHHAGAVQGSLTTPKVPFINPMMLTGVAVSLGMTGNAVDVEIVGTSEKVTVPAGQSLATLDGLNIPVASGGLSLRIVGNVTSGITLTARLIEAC